MKLQQALSELIGAPIGFYSLPHGQPSGLEGYGGGVIAPFMPARTTKDMIQKAQYKKKKTGKKSGIQTSNKRSRL